MFMLFAVAGHFKPLARVRNRIFKCNTKYILRIIDIELQFAESNDIIIENTTVSYQFTFNGRAREELFLSGLKMSSLKY